MPHASAISCCVKRRRCEACSARLIKRTSVLAHKFLRHDSYLCENPKCGATYTGHSELTGIASPSGVPTSHSDLPPTPAYKRAQARPSAAGLPRVARRPPAGSAPRRRRAVLSSPLRHP
ncbi:ogr/Delta-like zinc finger family protein [Xanthomonas pisi]